MADKEKYYIGLNGQSFEVSREIYEVYYKGQRKEKYFTQDLKHEHIRVNQKTGEPMVVPSREDSYERLIEAEVQFVASVLSVEEIVMRRMMLKKLKEIMMELNEKERMIIHVLFYQEISEVKLAKRLGIARTTLQSKKYRILEKLKQLL